jgi:hypothetical protein
MCERGLSRRVGVVLEGGQEEPVLILQEALSVSQHEAVSD